MTIEFFRGQNRFLSNFYFVTVEYDGIVYPSVEHAFQAAKTIDKKERNNIRAAKTSAEAKRLGRLVTERKDWNKIKFGIMLELVSKKFQNEELKQKLINTGEEEIIEGNTWGDTVWGVCNGVGENRLGKILMQVRNEIKKNS